jgi:hypothetical protein
MKDFYIHSIIFVQALRYLNHLKMKLFSRIIIFSLLLSSVSMVANAQRARKYSNEFLSIGVNPRALAMSNSVVASVDDISAGYWNPAGLARSKEDIQLSFMHSEYFSGIANYDYGSFGVKLNNENSVGISLIRFGVDNILNTLDLIKNGQINYNNIKTFSAVDYAFLVSFSHRSNITGYKGGSFQKSQKLTRKNTEGLYYGGNVKVIHRTIGSFATAWGFGLDAGAQYNANGWNFGVMAKDITSTFNAWNFTWKPEEKAVLQSTDNVIPSNSLEITLPRLILGAGKKVDFNKNVSLLTEVDLDVTFDGKRNAVIGSDVASFDPHIGLEGGIYNIVFIRAGIGTIQTVHDFGKKELSAIPTVGVGLKLKNVYIDYALTSVSGSLYSNAIAIRFGINKDGNK